MCTLILQTKPSTNVFFNNINSFIPSVFKMNRMSSLIYRAYIVPFYRVLHENLLELKSKLKKNSLLAIYLIIVCFTLNNCLHLYSISQILVFYIVLCVSVVMWFSPFPIYLSCAYFLSVTYDCINTIIIIINQYIS